MAVFLLILKIIGLVLLGIIALILLLGAIILFVPIRYRIKAEKPLEGNFSALAGFSFLLHILSGKFTYDNEIDYSVRVFGIKIYPRKKKAEEPAEEEKDTSEASPTEDKPQENEYEVDWNEPEPVSETTPETVSEENADTGADEEDIFDKIEVYIERFIEKISSKYDAISKKYESIRFKIRFFDKMRNDERNQQAVAYIKKKALKLLKKIAPKSVKGFVHFGFEDPATTGKILMYLAMIYPVLPRKLTIDPGFDDTDIYGNIIIKGHFSLITPVMCFIGVYFNKDIRRMRRLFKKYKEKVS